MSTSPSTSKTTITLIGFLGNDPIERFTKARTVSKKVPDPVVEDRIVEREVTIPARPYWKLSLEIHRGGKTAWHDCIVWNPEQRPAVQSADLARKGDRVVLTGYHESYTFTRHGEIVSGKHFVVETFRRIG
jgi:single-stranded DNA-binding protein